MNKTSRGSLGGEAQEGSKAGAPGNAPCQTPAVGKQPTLQKANAATQGLSLHQWVCPGSAMGKREEAEGSHPALQKGMDDAFTQKATENETIPLNLVAFPKPEYNTHTKLHKV